MSGLFEYPAGIGGQGGTGTLWQGPAGDENYPWEKEAFADWGHSPERHTEP